MPVTPHGELRLRVLSYNVHGLPFFWSRTKHFREIGRILRTRREQGSAPQLVAIQEGFHEKITDLFAEAGYPYRKSGPGPTWPRGGSGLVILSEFPILESKAMVFDHRNSEGSDWNSNKGVEYLKLQLPGLTQPLELLNTHLQADYGSIAAPTRATIAARRRQIAEMSRFFFSVTSADGPALFVGDFNTNPRVGDYYDIVGGLPLTDSAEACSAGQSCATNTDPLADLLASMDHQFFRSGAAVKVAPVGYFKTFQEPVGGQPLSDHDGLEVEYLIRW